MTFVHPLDHPSYGEKKHHPVYYLSHPLAPDNKFTYEQNLRHVMEMVQFFNRDLRVKVIAPYYEMCMVLDNNKIEDSIHGLEADEWICEKMGHIIMVGHKESRGMTAERNAVDRARGVVLNFVTWPRKEIAAQIGRLRLHGVML